MKDEIYGNRVTTDLKIPEIKLYVSESITEDFKKENFKFSKSSFVFTRVIKKDVQTITFNFINSAPLNFKIKFFIRIINSEIEYIKRDFSIKNKSELFDFATLQLFMGDFVEENVILRIVNKWNGLIFDKTKNEYVRDPATVKIKNLTKGQISGFEYEVYDNSDLMEAVNEIRTICSEKVIPLCNQFNTLGGIDKFFEKKQLWSINSFRQSNFEVELIAAKLNGKRNLSNLYTEILLLIDKGIEMGVFEESTKIYIQNLYNYLK